MSSLSTPNVSYRQLAFPDVKLREIAVEALENPDVAHSENFDERAIGSNLLIHVEIGIDVQSLQENDSPPRVSSGEHAGESHGIR